MVFSLDMFPLLPQNYADEMQLFAFSELLSSTLTHWRGYLRETHLCALRHLMM